MAPVCIFTSFAFTTAIITDKKMPELLEQSILCPYCNESITVLVDDSEQEQEYIEDCQVCCRPIDMSVSFDMQGFLSLEVKTEND